jgi:hypothetical protein
MRDHKWARLLAYITGLVNQQLLLQNEYLIAENRILRSHLPERLRLTDPQRSTLAEIAKRLGRKALAEVHLRQTGNHPGLVPPTHCPEVRRIKIPQGSGSPAGLERSRRIDCPDGEGKSRLGI